MKKYFFLGIGGSGMSALAHILLKRGNRVGGSDRSYDRHNNMQLFDKLQRQGVKLRSQQAHDLGDDVDCVVVSSAIEQDHAQLQKARARGIPVVHRAELLARIFNAARGIGIAGTSGKTTVTGMVAAIMDAADRDPTVINGGIIKNYESQQCLGNARGGRSDYVVSEVDESDGSILRFKPEIGVITNITKDHKEIDELRRLFRSFGAAASRSLVLNADCPETRRVSAAAGRVLRFGFGPGAAVRVRDIELQPTRSRFRVGPITFDLSVPGKHNIANALAAIAVGVSLDIPLDVMQQGLAAFRGIRRRLEVVGRTNGVTVVDDFAHNPHKIGASIAALKQMGRRLLVIYQPHGYGPTRFLLRELGDVFSRCLNPADVLVLLDIYDAGGTAERTLSSRDLLNMVSGPEVLHAATRDHAVGFLKKKAQPDDVVAVMGARDDTLSLLARQIFDSL